MFDCLFKPKFYSKCKSSIKLTKIRIEMIRKRRNAVEKFTRNDIADLLRYGFDMNAYQRAERLLDDYNISACYDLIEQFCEHLSSHLAVMDKQRECPEECREAVSSLIFAAARFADLPELRELRSIFSERFEKPQEYYVNKEFVEKLKRDRPSKDMKLQLMRDIASESGLDWNSEALENELHNAQDYGKKPDDVSPARDDKVETSRRNEKRNEAVTLSGDSGEESEDDEPVSYKNLQPPYTESEVGNSDSPRETEESDSVLKISPTRDNIGTSKATRKDGSSRRAASLPIELTSPPKSPKGHARASSYQPEISNSSGRGHVHPKLPDYDDVRARLAALRGN